MEAHRSVACTVDAGFLTSATDDASLPGTHFRLPMTLVLDSLRDDSLTCRRLGEAWMRCSLKSYLRSASFQFWKTMAHLFLQRA